MFHTQSEARAFFEQHILEQADAERVDLSPDERLMLRWSESEPDSVADPALATRLASHMSDDEYEEKIAGLVARSYAADIARDPTAKKRWADAFRVLNQGDHYILIAINRAVGAKFSPWWKLQW
jgi:hypothetical protein